MQLDDLKILICDDSILARKQMKDIINSIGSPTIIEAANGQLAIDMYKEHKPNLTFIDIVMPVKDGNAAISEIMEYDSSATIFVASSVGTQSELKKALAAGACDFIQKPIDKDQVISLIKKHIGKLICILNFLAIFSYQRGISLMSSFLTLSKKKHKSTQSSVLLPSTQGL